jgi:hypothetical protein
MKLCGWRGRCLAGLALVTLASCSRPTGGPGASERDPSLPDSTRGFHFVDVASEAGLTRVTHAGRSGKDHLLDSAGTGAAWLDYDRDGHLDAYLVNGWKLSRGEVVEKGRNALYRNRGDGTFEDVTEAAGVGGGGAWGSGQLRGQRAVPQPRRRHFRRPRRSRRRRDARMEHRSQLLRRGWRRRPRPLYRRLHRRDYRRRTDRRADTRLERRRQGRRWTFRPDRSPRPLLPLRG